MTDKHTTDIETLLQEIQQLKFELKAADRTYELLLQDYDKSIAELKDALQDMTDNFYVAIGSRNEIEQEKALGKAKETLKKFADDK